MLELTKKLFELRDEEYAAFHGSLIPEIPKNRIIGVRVPEVRRLAKEYRGTREASEFLKVLPHEYYDEDILHGALLCFNMDFEECLRSVEEFLPYIDNWATGDLFNPKALAKDKDRLLPKVLEWMASEQVYVCRYGMRMLMCHFLDEEFKPEYLERVAGVTLDEYYINMMKAWYFATALVKQWEATIPYIEQHRLTPWVHNKTIQKARESYRVSKEHKEYLKELKVR